MPKWFANTNSGASAPAASAHAIVDKWRENASAMFTRMHSPLEISAKKSSKLLSTESLATQEWIYAAMQRQTGQDRICAITYLINAYPLHCLHFLDSLVSLITPAKQRDCICAIEAVYQLFLNTLLPPHRTLVSFPYRPFNLISDKKVVGNTEELLCLWYFEDQVKIKFHRFVKSVERLLLMDTTEGFKRKAMSALCGLASKTPELRSLVLGIVVNKLGDRSKVLASSAIHKLRSLCQKNTSLMLAVVEEVRSFLFRPNLLERSKYYAIVLLSSLQLPTSKRVHKNNQPAAEIAVVLVKIYTAFFRAAVKAAEVPERLIAALLTGLSRAAPFVPESFTDLMSEVNDLFTLVHKTSFNVSLQALSVLYQLSVHRVDLRDRYYQALYRKLLDPGVEQTSRAASLLHLVYRSMLSDTDQDRLVAFTHRLLRVCVAHSQPGFTVGCLILLSKVNNFKNGLLLSQSPGESNPLDSAKDVAALLNKSAVQPMILSETNVPTNSDDEEEHFSDAPDSDCSEAAAPERPEPVVASWDHRSLSRAGGVVGNSVPCAAASLGYRPEARDPRFARVYGVPVWPLVLLGQHAHPSVSLLSRKLLSGQSIVYTGNPFDDFSLAHFLDRFAFKKPKPGKRDKTKSSKVTKPPPGRLLQPKKSGASIPGHRGLPVNSTVFRQLAEHNVPADEQFFHSYFKFLETRGINKAEKRKKREDDSASDSSVSDEEFDTYLEKHEKGLIPSDEELDLDDKVTLNPGDFTDSGSEEPDVGYTGEQQEDIFSAMDGLENGKAAKSIRISRSGDEIDVAEDAEMESDDASDSDGETVSRKRSKLDSLFASADELNRLYDVQETRKQRRQRLWEEERSDLTGGGSRRKHHGGGGGGGGGGGSKRNRRPSLHKRPKNKRVKRK